MLTAQDLHLQLDHALKSLRRAVRNIRAFHGNKSQEFPAFFVDHPVVHLQDGLLTGTRVFASRESMLRAMPFPRGATCVEIGTSTGAFARCILEALDPSELHLIDIDFSRLEPDIAGNERVRCLKGDSAKLLDAMPSRSVDFAYVDADHAYGSVRREIAVLRRVVKPGGWVMFNDYTRWSITEVVSYGVVTAVNEFLVENGIAMEGIALSGTGHFDVCIRMPDLSQAS
ncbi:class I SAM-dependent methyltransferase [Neoroseomonas soli]|uniref:Class I SAM-dependent methyltransferase n=1 Tax=Neoroseomonas soli TaxID=1081025 RepID=A0A9X9WUV1_9PROT|nr:class I SAM-dependent methyltransferase [Neoroseomonas soli]MBR0670930.1 class I SAM-dependent methyltransferase [Neoroseomonas soli]